ncbi:DUF58 domain-containing protein [Undibacterium cyanobacteriorum]|uniref:DUF58 domain-containing protein n=1 Tax=Undibacterium cyanobacteriorum TaxID=3073561 RepID=A0ABY9RGG7_9BURK|nr:DUF58 domain-containing protein [Undibacterium sp. 20NA77.5]WMW79375.1 DUF58 domain-containing protein [Undibacterium sp. 20NA77.5]
MALLDPLRRQFRRVVFLEKAPEPGELTLTQRRVFTLPSKPGLAFLLVLVICFLTSTNYNLNLGFGMTYLLGGIAIVNAFYTFRNLAYLKLSASDGAPIFVGDNAEFHFHVNNADSLARYALHFSFRQSPQQTQVIDLEGNENVTVKLKTASQQRGYMACPRVQIQTWFPLGLLRAWSTWLPDSKTLVYPRPEDNPPPLPTDGPTGEQGISTSGQEEFSGVRMYQQGDPLKHLSWKHIARVDLDAGGNLISKQFSGASVGAVSIIFSELPAQLDLESKISRMTAWVLDAEHQGLPYFFEIGRLSIGPDLGEQHRNTCLKALACFGVDESNAITSEVER